MYFILWLIAVILVISGIVSIIRGGLILGIVLIVAGLLIGPGGVSIAHADTNWNGTLHSIHSSR